MGTCLFSVLHLLPASFIIVMKEGEKIYINFLILKTLIATPTLYQLISPAILLPTINCSSFL